MNRTAPPRTDSHSTGPLAQTSHLPPRSRLAILCFSALGVVYGDIGTSPLYALRECFHGAHAIAPTPENVLGVLSLVFWALVIVISIKYLVFVMRADNRGEGGILALMSLLRADGPRVPAVRRALILMGLFGAALLYGDGIITPAISVLSAVEGLNVATSAFEHLVLPATVVILVVLFLFQKRGTGGVGAVFGPIMVIWFITIGFLGVLSIARRPMVLSAADPRHAVRFFSQNGAHAFLVLGAVFLVVTGGEALYADMGHFGRRPIRIAWFSLVLPALLANYFGQGALLLDRPSAAENPFYRLSPAWALFPMVILSTVATVIASQAVISGAFSLTRQAVRLGYSPRLEIRHTSPTEIGQIYAPAVNWALMAATVALVLAFGSSSNLAAAYGVAVTATMTITTVLLVAVAREKWRWSRAAAGLLAGFLVIDLAFLGANLAKIEHGGWFPLVVAALILTLMTTWRTGRRLLNRRLLAQVIPVEQFAEERRRNGLVPVAGTAIYLSTLPEVIPPALLYNCRYNGVVHRTIVLLTVLTEEVPHFDGAERVETERLDEGLYRMRVRYGFMEDPDVPAALRRVREPPLDLESAVFFLGKEGIIPSAKRRGMAIWRERLFAWMSRNSRGAVFFFCLPPDQTIELRGQVEI